METSLAISRGYSRQSSVRRALAESISGRQNLPAAWPISGYTQRMIRQIEREDLAGLLYHRWSTANGAPRLPNEASRKVMRLGQAAQAIDMVRTRELHRLFDALAERQVPTLLLKGAALAYWLYPSSFARPRGDTDLLVSSTHRKACEDVLDQLGYIQVSALPGQHVLRQSLWERHQAGVTHRIDLHHRLSNRHVFDTALDEDGFMHRSQSLSTLHEYARRPSLVDAVVHAIVHRVAHHHNDPRLVWLYDIHLLLSQASASELDTLREQLETKGLVGISQPCLAQCHSLFGTVDLKLQVRPRVREVSTRLLQPQSQTALMLMDLAAARDWKTRFGYLREVVWPGSEYLKSRFASHQHWPTIALQAKRWLGRKSAHRN